jgi:phosphoglycolate phosphatase
MKFIFWDWNGTLMNDAPVLWRSFNDLATSRGGRATTFESYRQIYRHPVKEMYEQVGVDFTRHHFEEMATEWHGLYHRLLDGVELHHDAVHALNTFKKRGSRQVVVSALPHDFLEKIVDRYEVRNFFEHISGIPDELAHSKVETAIAMARRLSAQGRDITVIGDSSHDAEVAKELSANCVLVARGAESRERLEAHGFQVLDDFSGLFKLPA